MKSLLLICTLAVLSMAAGSAVGDSYFKQATFMEGMEMMGQTRPARYDTSETWVGDGKVYARGSDGGVFIARTDLGKAYLIDHGAKSYSEMPFDLSDIFASIPDKDKKVVQEAAGMMGNIKTAVTSTDETKKIKGWNTSKFVVKIDMAMMQTLTNVYATQDIKIDGKLLFLSNQCMMARIPGFTDMINEMKKVKGVPVFSEGYVEMMGTRAKTSMELVEYKEGDAPAGIYDLPKGYKKIVYKIGMGGQ